MIMVRGYWILAHLNKWYIMITFRPCWSKYKITILNHYNCIEMMCILFHLGQSCKCACSLVGYFKINFTHIQINSPEVTLLYTVFLHWCWRLGLVGSY